MAQNESAPCFGSLHGHNFPYTGSDCMDCGVNQRELSGLKPKKVAEMPGISSALTSLTQKFQAPPPLKSDGIHSQLHWLVNEMRHSFGETAKKGLGSFGFYLGCLKRMGFESAYATWQEIEKSDVRDRKKLFWWKYGQTMKARKTAKALLPKV